MREKELKLLSSLTYFQRATRNNQITRYMKVKMGFISDDHHNGSPAHDKQVIFSHARITRLKLLTTLRFNYVLYGSPFGDLDVVSNRLFLETL